MDRKETKKARSIIKSRSYISQRKSIFLIRSGHGKTYSKRALQEAAALFWEFTRTHTHTKISGESQIYTSRKTRSFYCAGNIAQLVAHLYNMYEVLFSTPSTIYAGCGSTCL